jgi:hypothetical protein
VPSFPARKYLILWRNYYFGRRGGRVLVKALQDWDKNGHCGSAPRMRERRWSRRQLAALCSDNRRHAPSVQIEISRFYMALR